MVCNQKANFEFSKKKSCKNKTCFAKCFWTHCRHKNEFLEATCELSDSLICHRVRRRNVLSLTSCSRCRHKEMSCNTERFESIGDIWDHQQEILEVMCAEQFIVFLYVVEIPNYRVQCQLSTWDVKKKHARWFSVLIFFSISESSRVIKK